MADYDFGDLAEPVGKTTDKASDKKKYDFGDLAEPASATSSSTETKRKTPLSWYEKAKQADESGDPNHAGLAQGGRIADAVKQAYEDVQGKNGVIAALPGVGAVETGLNAISGVGSTVLGGLSSLGSLTKTGIENQMNKGLHIPTKEEFDNAVYNAANTGQEIQRMGTYQPRTGAGKLGSELLSVPLNVASEASRAIGGDIGAAAGNRAAGEEIGGALPAIASTVTGGMGALKGVQKIANLPKDAVPGKDFSVLRDLTPEQQARYKSLTDQGIKPTLGQITRDPEQWRFEEQTGAQTKSEPGKPVSPGYKLYQRAMDTNDALIKAVDDADKSIKGKPSTATEAQAGRSIAQALEKKAQAAKANINSLYEKARQSGETKQTVNSTELEKYIDDEAEEHPSLKVIANKLQKLKEKNGGKLTVDDAETLYRTASDQTTYGDPSSVYMGRVKQRINDMTAGAGGDLYRDARNARLAYGMEFEDRAGIARLIEKKPGSRTDYRTATEDVFKKTVLNGSRAELNDVLQSLKGIDLKKDPSGAQAIRNLQSQTVNYLLDKATEKGIPNAREAPQFSATQFRNAVKAIGEDKLNDILGPETVKSLQKTVENAKTVKQAPGKVGGSDTAQNFRDYIAQAALDSGKNYLISKIPGADMIKGYLKQKAADKMLNERTEEALNPRKASPETVKKMVEDLQRKHGKEVKNNLAEMAKKSTPAAAAASQSANKLKDYVEDQ